MDIPMTWGGLAAALSPLIGVVAIAVNVRGQLQAAAKEAEEKTGKKLDAMSNEIKEGRVASEAGRKQIYQRFETMEAKMDRTYARKDVVDLQVQRAQDAADEAQRTAQMVADRLHCPVRVPAE